MFGEEGKLGQVSRKETPLIKSLSCPQDHSLIKVRWDLIMGGRRGGAKQGHRCFTFDFSCGHLLSLPI